MKKLLVVCPSRGRTEKLQEMIRTFKDTCYLEHSDLVVLLDMDDECLNEYMATIPKWVMIRTYDKSDMWTTTTEIINLCFEEFKDKYEFFSVTNDDFKYQTKFWDLLLCSKNRIATGFEPNMFEAKGKATLGFPVTSVIDAEICKAVGWLQYPKLSHCMGDNVWWHIGKRLKIMHFDPQVIYYHENPFIVTSEKDATFDRVNNPEIIAKEVRAFNQWFRYEIDNDLEKIRKRILV